LTTCEKPRSSFTRTDLEKREAEVLAAYAMRSAQSAGRRHAEPEHAYRTAYQRDRDRIVHCKAFRRLEYKTQVFLNHEGDHYRTRLTHTLEVAQIARTIARALRLNEDLTEAIALAHDVGHTPFGHSGEDALNELMQEHGGFEHNRQGLRVVELLENQYPEFPGLNLTCELRESIAKHHTRWDNPVCAVFEDGPPLLEAQVVELADSIAYDNHDLDDGLGAGIITEEQLAKIRLWRRAADAVESHYGDMDGEQQRKQIIRYLIDLFVSDVVEATLDAIDASGVQSPDDVRSQQSHLARFSPELREFKKELEDFLFQSLYRDYRIVRVTTKAKRFVKEIFRTYLADTGQLPPEYRRWTAEVGAHRAICDYIAGMTDRYAQDQYLRLFQPDQKL